MSSVSGAIDWEALKQQLRHSQHVLSEEFSPSPEMTNRLLKERAKTLATVQEDLQERTSKDWLLFLIAGEVYAVPPEYVVTVIPARQIAPIPCTPSHIMGVVSYMGRMVSIVDLRVLFKLPQKGLTDRNSLLIIAEETMEFGLLTDQVIGMHAIYENDILPTPEYLGGPQSDYLYGITSSQYAVLDAARLLADPKLIVNALG
ncbi:hypothetical protein BTA51_22510 [Hahella sp. CCB-MM4]|uniref:chemotaxis protein CheW n=1 Tax=Hahella sp. (strain CCB-MM4) TaxID=1926491 RepID=UPI000B9C2133|nr:chemotaxis protein CheW [Hahella sp. CCB-MM4]OZG71150.1 hypothetical protein BTA51_22510 [Hahella sp. CCB-MM4]